MQQKWALKMNNLILNIKERVDISGENSLEEDSVSQIMIKYEKVIKQGYKANPPPEKTGKRSRSKRGKALCMVERMNNHKTEILRFMKEKDVFSTIFEYFTPNYRNNPAIL